jgi:hypothetical protein
MSAAPGITALIGPPRRYKYHSIAPTRENMRAKYRWLLNRVHPDPDILPQPNELLAKCFRDDLTENDYITLAELYPVEFRAVIERATEARLSFADITTIPPWVANLKAVVLIDLSFNEIMTLPRALQEMTSLCHLNLTGCSLPREAREVFSHLPDRFNKEYGPPPTRAANGVLAEPVVGWEAARAECQNDLLEYFQYVTEHPPVEVNWEEERNFWLSGLG